MNKVANKAVEHLGSGLSITVLSLAVMAYLLPGVTWRSPLFDVWWYQVFMFLPAGLSHPVGIFFVPITVGTLIIGVSAVVLYLNDMLNLHRGLKFLGFGFTLTALYLAITGYINTDLYLLYSKSGGWYQDIGTYLVDLPDLITYLWFPVFINTVFLASTLFCLNELIKKIVKKQT